MLHLYAQGSVMRERIFKLHQWTFSSDLDFVRNIISGMGRQVPTLETVKYSNIINWNEDLKDVLLSEVLFAFLLLLSLLFCNGCVLQNLLPSICYTLAAAHTELLNLVPFLWSAVIPRAH